MQEFNTAKECVLAVFPNAEIISNRTNAYPIRVVVAAHTGSESDVIVWEGRQQSLFLKNRSLRIESMNAIKTHLVQLKGKK